jgi:hypothetical protein
LQFQRCGQNLFLPISASWSRSDSEQTDTKLIRQVFNFIFNNKKLIKLNYFYKLDCDLKLPINLINTYCNQSCYLDTFEKYSTSVGAFEKHKKCFLKGRNRALWSWSIPTTITLRWNSITTKTKYIVNISFKFKLRPVC